MTLAAGIDPALSKKKPPRFGKALIILKYKTIKPLPLVRIASWFALYYSFLFA